MHLNYTAIGLLRNLFLLQVMALHLSTIVLEYSKKYALSLSEFILPQLPIYNQFVQPTTILALLSGFLFFQGVSKVPLRQFFIEKIKIRYQTIFLPLVAWTLITIVGVNIGICVFDYLQIDISSATNQFNLKNVSLVQAIWALWTVSPLWFLVNLFVMFLFSPVIYSLANYRWVFWSVFVVMAVGTFHSSTEFLFGFLAYRFVMFYWIGAYLSINQIDIFAILENPKFMLAGLVLAGSVFCVYPFLKSYGFYQMLMFFAGNIFAFIVVYQLAKLITNHVKLKVLIQSGLKNSFFLYTTHAFAFALMGKMFVLLMLRLQLKSVLLIVPTEIWYLGILVTFIWLMNRLVGFFQPRFPQLIGFLSGNRS